jgi:pSer/pThr/pTyr-binding forkhead associated (FHA) protein
MIMETETEPVPLAWLAVLEGVGGRSGVVYQLKQETVIGRTAGDLVLNEDPAVSGEHVKIKLETTDEEEQFFVLYDLASSNGTYIGDRETYQDDENRVYRHVLEDGDFILVGQTTLVFKQV